MISVKYAIIMAVGAFAAGSFFASPLPQAIAEEVIAAVVANNVICNGCVGTSDLANNAVTSPKIKDGEVKTADLANSAVTSAKIRDGEVKVIDIATDAVGADELRGVTELLFLTLTFPSGLSAGPGEATGFNFFVSLGEAEGMIIDSGDGVVATFNANTCFFITKAEPVNQHISITARNLCSGTSQLGGAEVSVIVFDK